MESGSHLAQALGAAACVLALTTAARAGDLVPLAQTEDGDFTFSLRKETLTAHPLGHAATLHAVGRQPRRLRRADPDSPEYVAITSQWVVACHQGTFAIVQDVFFGPDGREVARFDESPDAQEAPPPGTVAARVLRSLCAYIGHGGGTPPQ
jgi:hypothetical protein